MRTRWGDSPLIMGIVNATPDSFSDGGLWADPGAAVDHALELVEQGADIIDLGGESTRPGATPVPPGEELSRLEPVLRDLVPSIDVPVSVDTYKASVAERCISLGASIVNDVGGLGDPRMAGVCASAGVGVVIMHANGGSADMPAAMGPDFMEAIRGFLRERTATAIDAGVDPDMIVLDPGIGFGKDPAQCIEIMRSSSFFSDGRPVLSGPSRKRFLSSAFPGMGRDEATAMAAAEAVRSGASIVRVHDVARTRDALGI